jgi:hypothetical protein
MSTQENDPDILQLLDESDIEWVRLWRKAALKEKTANTLEHFVSQQENMKTPHQKIKTKF